MLKEVQPNSPPDVTRNSPTSSQPLALPAHEHHTLESSRLSSSPISQLPVELLLLVFSCFPVTKDESYYTSKGIGDEGAANEQEDELTRRLYANLVVRHPWNWMDVTRVCKLWQSVAYSSRSLWFCPPLYDAPWTCRSLELSDTLPIHVISNAPKEGTTPKNILLALQNMSRIREISILGRYTYADAARYWKQLQKYPAPELEVLSIDPGPTALRNPPFPSNIFSGQAPSRLRKLQLYKAVFDTSKPFFVPSLTFLELKSCEFVWEDLKEMLD
ncbi:hypothetical protein OF83DRAFT_1101653, partial [Amylostereum chailletii]